MNNFSEPYSLLCSLVHFLNILEPNKKHHIRDILTVKRSNLSLKVVREFLKKMNSIKKGATHLEISGEPSLNSKSKRIIHKLIPDLKLLDDYNFIVLKSPIYHRFNRVQKLALYFFSRDALNKQKTITVPSFQENSTFLKYLKKYWEVIDKKVFLLPESNLILSKITERIYDLIYNA